MSTRTIICLQGEGTAVQIYKGLDGYPSRMLETIAIAIGKDQKNARRASAAGIAEALMAGGPFDMELDWRRDDPQPMRTAFGGRGGLSWCYFIDTAERSASVIGSSLDGLAGSAGSHADRGLSDPAAQLIEFRPWFAPERDETGLESKLFETLVEQRGDQASAKGRWAAQELENLYLLAALDRFKRPGMEDWQTQSIGQAPSQVHSAVRGMGMAAESIRHGEMALESMGYSLNRLEPPCLAAMAAEGRKESECDRLAATKLPGFAVVKAWEQTKPAVDYFGPILEIGSFYAAQRAVVAGEPSLVIHELSSLSGADLKAGQLRTINYRGGEAFAPAPAATFGRSR